MWIATKYFRIVLHWHVNLKAHSNDEYYGDNEVNGDYNDGLGYDG